MARHNDPITTLVLAAADKARRETANEPEPGVTGQLTWPVQCTVGPGLEGAIACESKVGYVNGSKGCLIYRGYDIFDLAAHSSFEETTYLLLHGALPGRRDLERFSERLRLRRRLQKTLRILPSFPLEEMSAMAALRIGVNLMRLNQTHRDAEAEGGGASHDGIGTDEDSIAMETPPKGQARAVYEFHRPAPPLRPPTQEVRGLSNGHDLDACDRLVAGLATAAAAVHRIRCDLLPIEPDPALGHAANLLYMINGTRPSTEAARILDIALILHADHGMNASTFAAMVVASTLADVYFAVGAGIGALSGPLHGGANEQVLTMLEEIGSPRLVRPWLSRVRQEKRRIMGFGHRVYKAYDPRARVLQPLAEYLANENRAIRPLYRVAQALEREVVATLGHDKGIFPNVDFYSGLVYRALGIPDDLFTVLFAVSRVAGWTARTMEYLEHNRIFRPRALYSGSFGLPYVPLGKRGPAGTTT